VSKLVKVGVLALQGDFLEHMQMLKEVLNVDTVLVKCLNDLKGIDALIIPGGESTTIGRLIRFRGLDEGIIGFANEGKPIIGTCAGAVLLANKVLDRVVGEINQPVLGLMNITVVRNIFGRQKNSFITKVYVEGIGDVNAVFIRAPGIIEAHRPARIISYLEYPVIGKVGAVAVQGSLLAVTFHPEISSEKKLYEYFLSMVRT
jgi:5'-phosphate synthase pdxT subunit